MKKVLAIVLTLAMLLSMVVVGTSAARVVTENKTENHYWTFPAGHSWHPVKFDNPSTTVEMDIRLDDATANLGCYGLSNAPAIGASYVGLKDSSTSVAYTFEVGTWYSLKFVSADGSTTIYVNGAEVGTVAAEITYYDSNQFYWAPVLVSMDNVKVGGQVFDFEGDYSAWNTESGQGQLVLEEIVTYANENVFSYPTGSKFWRFNDDTGAYIYTTLVSDASAGYQLMFNFRLNGDDSEFRSYFGTDPVIGTSKIGVGSSTQACSLETGVWYKALFNSIAGAGTGIVVWDASNNIVVQTASSNNLGASWCGGAIRLDIDDLIVISADGSTVISSETFDDGVFDNKGDSNGAAAQDTAEARIDLGEYYWNFQAGNSWHPVKFTNPSSTVEMDIKLDDASSNLGCYGLSNAPSFTTTSVGVTSKTIAYNFDVDTWYHVKFVSADGSTAIYVDGALAGTVDAEMTYYDGNQFYWAPVLVSMDNVSVGGQVFDFEGDNSAWNTESGQGQLLKYEIKVDSIFDHFETTEPGGEAYLIENTPVYGKSINKYLEMEGLNPNGNNFIMNFDLALIPINDHSDGACFEIWTNKSSSGTEILRWKVGTSFYGTETGSTKDYTAFEWGDTTKDNFHNITYVMKADYDIAQIYIDKELVYEGRPYHNNWGEVLAMLWNANAIIDNIQMMDLSYNSLNPSLSGGRTINLDAEDFCATNGHINGFLTRDVEPTCYSLGNDRIDCAVCGEVVSNSDVAMVAHNWADYDINRKTEDGLVYTYCKNDGCTEKRYTALPAADTYTGTLYEYYDMSDDMVLVVDNNWSASTWTQEDGVVKFGTSTNNYNIFDPVNNIPANNWSWNLDIIYRGTFDTSDAANYGHVMYFWQGGDNGITNQLGYNADHHKLFLVNNNGNPKADNPFPTSGYAAKTVDFTMVEGEAYNIAITVAYNTDGYPDDETQMDNWFATLCLYVNGEKMIEFDTEDDAFWYVPGAADATNLSYAILRDFGVSFDVDAMAFGSSDFAYTNRVYNGDVDGDYAITAADALLMRKYLARVIDIDALVQSRADANNDGAINAKDQLVIRRAIAA
ncbi:MAG: dockerin type I domain-containing protein [Candidatus Avispirillum sp.]